VPCGQSGTVCGISYVCSCEHAVAPFPCEPNRPEEFPYENRPYTRDEYNRTPVPLWKPTGPFVRGLSNGCSYAVAAPAYGFCEARGGDASGRAHGDWVAWIPFAETKPLCGVPVACQCERPDAGG
jgi:hypothetical protein